ncbi:MAG: MerR family transcriptional regulator [Pseudomonadota bacterium]
MTMAENAHNLFSIGAVARLTGLTTHSLRKWEDRYQVVTPLRSDGGDRRYTSVQVARLTLLKELVDAGHSISELAGLTTERLKARSLATLMPREPRSENAFKVAVLGEFLPALLEYHNPLSPSLDVIASGSDAAELDGTRADAVIVETCSLGEQPEETLHTIRRLTGARCLVVLYRFSTRTDAARLRAADVICLRMPVDYQELQRQVVSMVAARTEPNLNGDRPPPQRYSKELLARLMTIQPSIGCECPGHVAEIVATLMDFEAYSANCESKNAADAQIHRNLHLTASRARAAFEAALTEVAAHEGISLTETLPRRSASH